MTTNISSLGAAMPPAMSGASAMASPQQKMTNLFNQIDSAGSGAITQAQFNQAFQSMNPPAVFQAAGSQTVWQQLDPSGSGQVSQQDFVNGMKGLMSELRQGTTAGNTGSAAQTASAATQALNSLGQTSINILA
jgi:hypothetical protein